MIRVLQIGMSDNLGGIEIFLINYYRKINKEKIQFDFINMYENDLCFQDEIELMGGKIYKVSNEKKYPLRFKKELKKIITDNKYEIVHVHKNSLAFIDVLKVLKKCNVKVKIIHSHNTQSSRPNFLINILHNINKLCVKNYCDYFYACSNEAGNWMFTKKIVNSNKFFLINNAIDLNKFKFNSTVRKKIRQELNISDDTIVIGHVGRFTSQKNHDFLIDLFYNIHKKNKNSVLLLVGQGPLYAEIKQKVKMLNLEDNVLFVGQKNNVNDYYQAFDFFLFPSIYEGLGIALIEAQASGLSCLASTNVPLLAKVTNAVEYLKLTDPIETWVKKYEILISSFERLNLYEEITKNGFNIDEEVNKIEKNYINFYEM